MMMLFLFKHRYEMLGQAQRDLTAEQAAHKLFTQPDVHYKTVEQTCWAPLSSSSGIAKKEEEQ